MIDDAATEVNMGLSKRRGAIQARDVLLLGLLWMVGHGALACGGGDGGEDVPDDEIDAGGDAGEDTGLPDTDDPNNDTPDADDPNNDTPDADDPDGDDGPDDDLVITTCAELPAVGQGVCEAQAGSGHVLLRGQVLAPGEVLAGGEVLVSPQGEILCVGCDCSGSEGHSGATVVTCPEGVISPGLINPHDHITFTQNDPADWGEERFDHRHDWRRGLRGHNSVDAAGRASAAEVSWGELRQVLGGTTSLVGSGSANGLLRNLDRANAQEGLGQGEVELATFPLGDTGGQLRSSGCGYPDLPGRSVLGEDAYVPHVSEGIDAEARNEFLCLSSEAGGGVDVTEDNGAFIHSVGLLPIDGRELASSGTAVIWSPRSNISLYGHTALVTMLDRQGVRIALGTDWTPSGSINMLRELQCADYLNQFHYDGYFTDRQLWAMSTINAAEAMAVDDGLGALAEGFVADIAIFDGAGAPNPYRAIIEGNPGRTALVLRAGEPLYGDADIMAVIPGGQEGCEPIPGDVCGVPKAVCVQRELGQSFSALEGANRGSYDLFFCDVPRAEPTCVPSRPGEFDGQPTDDDFDGDGVFNEVDNCPRVFNPSRPVDDNRQGDFDEDGVGDACDPCPMDPDTEDCSAPDPADRDADGVANIDDNCPSVGNPDQDDADQDGKGDACDACPDDFNPGEQGCPVSIYAIKTGEVEEGTRVRVSGVVTARAGASFFIQVPEAQRDELRGEDFSGIFLFVPSDNPGGLMLPERGDAVAFDATVSDFFGQTQLTFAGPITVEAQGAPLPSPTQVEAALVATGGARADALEATLVEVECQVEGLNPPAGPGDSDPTNELLCQGGLRVNDFIHAIEPQPLVGDVLRVVGVLRFANADSKVEPRDADDVEFLRSAPPALAAFEPSRVFAEVTDAPVPTLPALRLTLDRPALTADVTIAVSSQDPQAVAVPAEVVVPQGASSVEVPVRGLTPGAVVEVVATLGDSNLSVTVEVLDPERVPALASLAPEALTVLLGAQGELTATLTLPAPANGAEILVRVSDDGILGVPQAVQVEPRALSAAIALTPVGVGEVTVTASIGDSVVTAQVEVVETPPLGLVLSEVFYDADGGDDGKEWVEIFNGTGSPVDLSGFSLGSGGVDYTTSTLQLEGVIPPGGCFVVGGPASDDTNANPTFDQAINFPPDLQNGGSDSDGLALFAVPADQITPQTVPIDAVIYDSPNSNGLLDETGQVGEPDVDDAGGGESVERTAEGWRIQAAPTPNNCDILLP